MRKSHLAAVTVSSFALAVASGASFGFNIVQNFAGGEGGVTTASPVPTSFSPYTPPDVNGAVGYSGTTEYVTEMINGYFGVYGATGTPTTQESLDTFWSNALAASGTTITGSFDPRIVYDPSSQRWFASSLVGEGSPNDFLIGVSDTSNPNGAWSGFALPSQPSPIPGSYVTPPSTSPVPAWADFDTLGVSGGNVFVSGNMYNTSNVYTGVSNIVAIPKASLTAYDPSIGGYQVLNYIPSFANQGVQNASGSDYTSYFYGIPGSNANQLVQTTIVGTSAGNYQVHQGEGSLVNLSVGNAATATPAASQPGLPNSIDAGDPRLSSNLTAADGMVWGTQMVANPSNSALDAIRWFAINPTNNTVLAQGILTNPSNSLYYGSIAVSKNGAIVIDFEESGASQNISTYVATGTFNGTSVTIGTPTLLNAGAGVYQQSNAFTPPNGTASTPRWGDYSTIQVDPNNPNEFWIFQELPNGTQVNQWDTQITAIDPPGGIGVTVPEPGVLSILLLGVAPLLLTLRRRKVGS